MAEIPVEKKGGVPSWIWWVLGLILIALLLWWLLSDDDDEVEMAEPAVVAEEEYAVSDEPEMDMDVATGPITTLAGLTGLAGLVGTDVDLDNIEVTELAGDMAFYVGEGANRTLVLFDEQYTPAENTEGEYDINPGSMVSIAGEVREDDGTLSQGVFANIPEDTEAYVYADTIEMMD